MPAGQNDDCYVATKSSCVTINVQPGRSYAIQIDGFNGVSGAFKLTTTFPVANDHFAE